MMSPRAQKGTPASMLVAAGLLFACAALSWGCGDDSSPGPDVGDDLVVDEGGGDIGADADSPAEADLSDEASAESDAEAGADADADGDADADADGSDALNACADVEPGSGGEGEPCAETAHCDGTQYCNRTRCVCYPPGECVVAEDCRNPGHSWPHDDCDGHAECTSGLCVWICP